MVLNSYGEKYSKYPEVFSGNIAKLLATALNEIYLFPGDVILDIGSRDGRFTHHYLAPLASAKLCRVYAIEPSKSMHYRAIKGKKTEDYPLENVIHVNKDFMDEDIHLVLCDQVNLVCSICNFMMKWKDKELDSLRKMYELLARGGLVCLVIVMKMNIFYKFLQFLQTNDEWKHLNNKLACPKWWDNEVENNSELFENHVSSIGFVIQKCFTIKDSFTFSSKVACAEYLISIGLAAECEEQLYLKRQHDEFQCLFQEFLDTTFGKNNESCTFDYELTLVLGKKE